MTEIFEMTDILLPKHEVIGSRISIGGQVTPAKKIYPNNPNVQPTPEKILQHFHSVQDKRDKELAEWKKEQEKTLERLMTAMEKAGKKIKALEAKVGL
jgi:hypothetical protein